MKPKKISRSSSNPRNVRPPSREQIEALAHAVWMDRGCPEGRDLDNWLEAERQLRGEIHRPMAADDIPASDDALDPDRALTNPIDRELDGVVSRPGQRSPTSL